MSHSLPARLDDIGVGAVDEREAGDHPAGHAVASRPQPLQGIPGPTVMGLLIARGPLENPGYVAGMIGDIGVTAVLVSRLGFIGDEGQQTRPGRRPAEASSRSGGLDQQLEDAGREVGHPQRHAVPRADQFDKFGDVAFVILAKADQSVSQVAVTQG